MCPTYPETDEMMNAEH